VINQLKAWAAERAHRLANWLGYYHADPAVFWLYGGCRLEGLAITWNGQFLRRGIDWQAAVFDGGQTAVVIATPIRKYDQIQTQYVCNYDTGIPYHRYLPGAHPTMGQYRAFMRPGDSQ